MTWVLFALAVVVVATARIRMLGLPLERDEGEYAYTGQLMLQGVAPYKLAYSMKFPGTAAAYAGFMAILGQTASGVHGALLLVNLIAVGLVFLLGRRLIGAVGGAAAGACYAILSLMPYVLGQAAHATHFVVLWALAGATALHRAVDRGSKILLFISGLLFGVALLMKQPGLLFVLFGAAYILIHGWRSGIQPRKVFLPIAVLVCGAIIPFGAACLMLWHAGVLPKFWFWTVRYAQQYGSRLAVTDGARILVAHLPGVMGAAWPLWAIAAVGLVLCVTSKTLRPSADFIITWALFSGLAVCAGFYFRPHYFILALPAISLLAGTALSGGLDFLRRDSPVRFIAISLFSVLLFWPVWREGDFFFQRSLAESNRMVNGTNPFLESVKIGNYLRAATDPTDTIAVLGSEPEIYFYSQRRSATGYIYTYGLMEPQPYAHVMQEEMIHEIENAHPKFVVLVAINKSWLAGPESDQTIFRWANAYCEANYDEVGLINIKETGTDYYLSGRPPSVKPAPEYILIYRRKT
jgi:Dolichyl-phosphate-mannose-protein mannosyltransferase